jgi:hypothetical protein
MFSVNNDHECETAQEILEDLRVKYKNMGVERMGAKETI